MGRKMMRWDIPKINEWLQDNSKTFVLLSTEYHTTKENLSWKCLLDGHMWEASLGDITRKNRVYGCPLCQKEKQKTKYTIRSINNYLEEQKKSFRCISDKFYKTKENLLWECTICTHTWETSWANIKWRNSGCRECYFDNKCVAEKTLNNFLEDSHYSLINYEKGSPWIILNCALCHTDVRTTWYKLKTGLINCCSECSSGKHAILPKSTHILQDKHYFRDEEFRIKLNKLNHTINLITENIGSSRDNVTFCCTVCSHYWDIIWNGFTQNPQCPKCQKLKIQKTKLENIKEFMALTYPMVQVISDHYETNTTPLLCKCTVPKCKATFYRPWADLRSGRLCPNCTTTSNGLGSKITDHQEVLEKLPALIYVLHCWDEEEEFYKIGKTDRTVKKRYGSKIITKVGENYNYEILLEIPSNRYEVYFLENIIHEDMEEFSYVPTRKFGGWTECYFKVPEYVYYTQGE